MSRILVRAYLEAAHRVARTVAKCLLLSIALALPVVPTLSLAESPIEPESQNRHKTPLGTWDIHVCNWPDRPPFYLTLFKTDDYDKIEKIEVFSPQGTPVGDFEMNKYLDFERPDKDPLRVLLTHMPLVEGKPEGRFTAIVTGKDGKKYLSEDYLIMNLMDRVSGQVPEHNAEVSIPWELAWDAPEGAGFYRVWIRDLWDDGKQIYRSGLLSEPRLELPEDLLQPDGWYAWRVHTRDTNNHILLGDFNHGSLTEWKEFVTIAE